MGGVGGEGRKKRERGKQTDRDMQRLTDTERQTSRQTGRRTDTDRRIKRQTDRDRP